MKYILSFLIFLFVLSALNAQSWKELDSLSTIYLENEELEKAEPLVLKAFELSKSKYGIQSKNYAKSLGDLAFYNYLKFFTIEKSTILLDSARRIFENLHDTICNEYMLVLNHLNYIYDDCFDYEKAEWCAQKCVEITKMIEGEASENYATNLHNLAWVYLHTSNFSKAGKYFEESYIIFRDSVRKNTESYAFLLNSFANYYIKRGFDNFAEIFMKKSLEIRKELYGEKNRWCAAQIGNLGRYYFFLGRYEIAESLLVKSADIKFELYGDNDIQSAYAYMDLAKIQWHKGNYIKAEELIEKGIYIFEKLKVTNYPDYYLVLKTFLSSLYVDMGEYKKAKIILSDAFEKCKIFFGEKSIYTTEVSIELAKTFYLLDDFKKAEFLYEKAFKCYDEILGGPPVNYGYLLTSLADVYIKENKTAKAEELYIKANEFYLERINKYYNGLSEKEKLEFNRTINPHIEKFYSFALKRYNENPEISSDLMNLSITTKGLILKSVTKMKNAILNSGDSILLNKYERMIFLRQSLANAYSLSKEEITKKGINVKVIEDEANEIDKELSSLKGIDYRFSGEKWCDIKEKMQNDECFVEFINFKSYDKNFSDTVIYYVGIIRKDFAHPVFVKLCNENDITKILQIKADSKDSYQKNSETSNILYNLIFKPIEPYLNNVEVIYLSPSGLLNKISFASLNIDGENYLCDKFNLRYLTNLKDYLEADKYYEDNKKFIEVIFGGINYDIDTSGNIYVVPKTSRGNEDEEWSPPADMIIQDMSLSNLTRWNFLQGTKEEAEKIKLILEKNKIESKQFTGNEASEETIKIFCKKNSPEILHIATHGFFFPEPNSENKNIKNPFKSSVNPLFRSGLLFAGANHVWMGGREIEGVENGILTAYEVSNMDLQNTELVVLSACETGLGDIKGGEGVYGLQRAFKVAGAKTIIMSLWKVPDKETVELMELFYSNWLEKKMTKHEAFSQAQKEMRKKYPPYYWAAFVMVE
jgi:CHAT domain-containing protein